MKLAPEGLLPREHPCLISLVDNICISLSIEAVTKGEILTVADKVVWLPDSNTIGPGEGFPFPSGFPYLELRRSSGAIL